MKTMKKTVWLLVMILLALNAKAEDPRLQFIHYIKSELKGIQRMSYDYQVFVSGPHTDTVKGKLVVAPGWLHDENNQMLIIKNNEWLYKVNHLGKTVILMDLKNNPLTSTKSAVDGNVSSVDIPDSLFLKYGQIQRISAADAPVLDISITFSESTLLRKLELKYDKQKKMLHYFRLEFDQLDRVNPETYDEEYIQRTVECRNFSNSIANGPIDFKSYFTVSAKGHITLNKYKNYELILLK